ncbi:MAG TPA: F0F1 ATP synthase subunit epsilon [Anaerolineaceae bacterium]
MPILCEIISQDRVVFKDDVDIVILPGSAGEMGILPNHAPLLTTLQYGVIRVRDNGEEEFFTVSGGIAEVGPTRVTILADAAENVAEIDLNRAEAARKRAEQILKEQEPREKDTYLSIRAALKRSQLRIDAVKRYKKQK